MSAENVTNATADRCVGHCCRLFYLPKSPAEMRQHVEEARVRCAEGKGSGFDADIALIASMAIEVAAHEPTSPDVTVRSGFLHDFDPARDDGKVHWYTCRNLTADGNCAVYATRPRMCSEYPYGRPCLYGDCQCAAARAGTMGRVIRPLVLGDADIVSTYLDAPQEWR